MFNNIGGKIKGLAVVMCVIGIIASVIGAITLWVASAVLPGFILLVAGAVGSWAGSLLTYGFGEIIDQLTTLNYSMNLPKSQTANSTSTYSSSWTCTKCKELNPVSKGFCISCGEQRH